MSNYINEQYPGDLYVDLPYRSHRHTLELLSFSDFKNSVNISLVYNQKLKKEGIDYFNTGYGFKLNIQKRIMIVNNVLVKLIDEKGNSINLIRNKNSKQTNIYNNYYTFDDESKRNKIYI